MVQLIRKNSFVILLIALSYLFVFILVNQAQNPIEEQYMYVVIQEGDTLWSVADQYVKNDRLSYEAFIEWTESTNNIQRNEIIAGSKIAIPVKASDTYYQTVAHAE